MKIFLIDSILTEPTKCMFCEEIEVREFLAPYNAISGDYYCKECTVVCGKCENNIPINNIFRCETRGCQNWICRRCFEDLIYNGSPTICKRCEEEIRIRREPIRAPYNTTWTTIGSASTSAATHAEGLYLYYDKQRQEEINIPQNTLSPQEQMELDDHDRQHEAIMRHEEITGQTLRQVPDIPTIHTDIHTEPYIDAQTVRRLDRLRESMENHANMIRVLGEEDEQN